MKAAYTLALAGALFALPQVALAQALTPQAALAQHPEIDQLVATHARAHAVPEALVHRVIRRESGYRPEVVHLGNIGLMQIKLGTARSLGFVGTAEELRDPETNLRYGIKYLAGAYRAANGDHRQAIHYYAAGYRYPAKDQAELIAIDPIAPVPLPRSRPTALADAFWQLEAAASVRVQDTQATNDITSRVDTPRHRLTLSPFRGELR